MGSYYVAQADSELMLIMPQPPKCLEVQGAQHHAQLKTYFMIQVYSV